MSPGTKIRDFGRARPPGLAGGSKPGGTGETNRKEGEMSPFPKTETTMKTAAIVYHKSDFDGICSLAIATKALRRHVTHAFPFNYGDTEPSAETLIGYDTVVIADVCLSSDTMLTLLKTAESEGMFNCIWIDHHASSIERSVRDGFSGLPGMRTASGKGACELAWEDFFPGEPVPRVVAYLSAHDVHDKRRFPWDDEVMPFQYGMREAYGCDAKKFLEDFDRITGDPLTLRRMINRGGVAYRYAKRTGSGGVEKYGFPVTINGSCRGICCLTNSFGSLAFEDKLKAAGAEVAVCVNRVSADEYRVSAYAPDGCSIDLGEYMSRKYHGGGHPSAAGGRMTLTQFVTLTVKQTM